MAAIADMDVFSSISIRYVLEVAAEKIKRARLLVLDGNIPPKTFRTLLEVGGRQSASLAYREGR